MKTKRAIKHTTLLCAASAMLLGGAGLAPAAGPVAVAPQQNVEVAIADASPVKFSLSGGAGYLTGEANEIVYWPTAGNHKASELTWQIDNLFMFGVGAHLRVQSWLTVNFDGWFKATDGDGSMDDYDWEIPGADWTQWSTHEDTDVTDASIIDLNAEFAVFRTQNMALKVIGGYKRDNFGWEAYGGDFVYSVNGFRDTTGSFADGLQVIGYEQTYESPYIGAGIGVNFSKFELASRLIYSPFVQGEAIDNHYLRNLVTTDEIEDGDMIAFDISGNYLINNHLSVLMAFTYQDYDTTQGDSLWEFRDQGVSYLIVDGAGMDLQYSLFTVSLKYTF